jgi:aspartate/methionine/tyrosine aminotransferase
MALCLLILDECGVACTPGLDFDPLRGGKYIRFSFSGETTVFNLQARCLFFLSRSFYTCLQTFSFGALVCQALLMI